MDKYSFSQFRSKAAAQAATIATASRWASNTARRALHGLAGVGPVTIAALMILALFVVVAGGLVTLPLAPDAHTLVVEIAVLAFAAVTAVAALAALQRPAAPPAA